MLLVFLIPPLMRWLPKEAAFRCLHEGPLSLRSTPLLVSVPLALHRGHRQQLEADLPMISKRVVFGFWIARIEPVLLQKLAGGQSPSSPWCRPCWLLHLQAVQLLRHHLEAKPTAEDAGVLLQQQVAGGHSPFALRCRPCMMLHLQAAQLQRHGL